MDAFYAFTYKGQVGIGVEYMRADHNYEALAKLIQLAL